ncbi:hypothetical protein Ppa06_02430 [Planomonospora parontospora subsp. parontospora]|uniref:SipW-cognate class signal peptide n=2 Tax=Planomonospora parontospora TaxID=58119 RepID=A0AA37F1U6_9ACTN|nr:hypothetical protein [Planomonospora parontospora]GGK46294.1 hypothetical protein GCM10010126_02440 [Planomonospora parontospora]GII06445.1 hypothetical protein Ppa06_02430 [Planomonospora parontospora subsp. parontospora]
MTITIDSETRTPASHRRPRPRRRRKTLPIGSLVTIVGLVGGAGLIWNASQAAFTAQTDNRDSNWNAGSVEINSDRDGAAAFSVFNVNSSDTYPALQLADTGVAATDRPNSGGSTCIKVVYTGTMTANIKLHAEVNGDLAPYLLTSVDHGTNSVETDQGWAVADPECENYVRNSEAPYVFGSANNADFHMTDLPRNYADSNSDVWTAQQGDTRWYRVSWLLPAVPESNDAQGKTAQVRYVWEAQAL